MKKNILYLLLTILGLVACTSKNSNESDSTSTTTPQTTLHYKADSLVIFTFDPTKKVVFVKGVKLGDINLVKRAFTKRDSVHSKIKTRDSSIDFVSMNFSMQVTDLLNFIDSIPTNGYLGISYGVKGKKNLSLHLLSMNSNYTVTSTLQVSSGTSIGDTTSFQNLKKKIYDYGFLDFNTDMKYSKSIFKKNESYTFFYNANSAGLFGANKKVFMYFIHDMYNTNVGFPNILFSNKDNIRYSDLNSYDPNSFLLGNQGQACCPPAE